MEMSNHLRQILIELEREIEKQKSNRKECGASCQWWSRETEISKEIGNFNSSVEQIYLTDIQERSSQQQ